MAVLSRLAGASTAATIWVTAALGIRVASVLALILLVGIGWMEGTYSTTSASRTRRRSTYTLRA